ncbi:MAG: hypothetical protein BGO21_08145 [Dyadobacter sp. 50-39]|uniref:hypothetical protein n=1 Tax=Dyadobacter sp. 50-39 TaxID=1895756 RepID=UPI00095EB2C1|nr:hypothetical protein [Dyadobacter sp. 50-39]OJV20536.1 MAG: hypothetical protein BGO21_08145 [Dyadobacter sp. 50-39]
MNITKEIIEKYHQGLCTPEEEQAVEKWLDDDGPDFAPIDPLPAGDSKFKIQDDMWAEISAALPQPKPSPVTTFFTPIWRRVAAVFVIGIAAALTIFMKSRSAHQQLIVIKNSSETTNRNLHERAYSISIGPKSNVEINNETGEFDFCGAVLINPKRDIELTIQGSCARADEKRGKMVLRKGQQYIALNYGNASHPGEVVILPQTSITGLPPLMQRQLMSQFNI